MTQDEAPMSSEMSPLTRKFARRWHVEPRPDGLFCIADDQGRHLRQRFFTLESADQAARQLT